MTRKNVKLILCLLLVSVALVVPSFTNHAASTADWPEISATTAPAPPAVQKKGGKGSDKAVKGTDSGQDPNVMTRSAKNNANKPAQAPSTKGGPKAKGGVGIFCVDNRTPWFVDIYLNREYLGTVAPYGDLCRYVYPGTASLYARSDFDDGSYLRWGPKSTVLTNSTYTWTIYP